LSSRIKLSPRRAAPADGFAEASEAKVLKNSAKNMNFFKVISFLN
jgi:hypothetical protein